MFLGNFHWQVSFKIILSDIFAAENGPTAPLNRQGSIGHRVKMKTFLKVKFNDSGQLCWNVTALRCVIWFQWNSWTPFQRTTWEVHSQMRTIPCNSIRSGTATLSHCDEPVPSTSITIIFWNRPVKRAITTSN